MVCWVWTNLKDIEKVVSEEWLEAVFAESVNVRNKLMSSEWEMIVEKKRLCGIVEGVVAVNDFVNFISGQCV